jgi:glycosyltransferase involved in cell wall biosynthesis
MSRPVVIVPGGIGGTGGLSIDVRNLANGLAARERNVVVACTDGDDPALVALTGAEIVPLRSRGPAALSAAFGLHTGIRRVLRDHPGAVVHIFGSMPSYLTAAALMAARRRGHPVVWTPMFHRLRSRVWGRGLLLRPMLAFDRLVPQTARFVDVVGAATDAEAAIFAKHARVELLPPVVEPAAVLPEREANAFRKATGIDSSPLIVVVASRDEPRKGLDFAATTFERLRLTQPGARLLLVGVADAAGLPAGAVSLGRVSEVDLTRALRAADVVFVPSLFEAFSRVVIESWQQDTPVVVSDGVALAPVVETVGGNAVPYGDIQAAATELERLLKNRAAAWAEGRAGRRLVEERYVSDVLLDRAEEIYEQLPGGSTPKTSTKRMARAA